MKSNVTLIHGEERSREHPDTFLVPDDTQKQAIRPGDSVKVGIEMGASKFGLGGERIWVDAKEVNYPHFVGTVTSAILTEDHGVADGDELSFEARHILAIQKPEDGKFEELWGDAFAHVSAEELEANFPSAAFIRCDVDQNTEIGIINPEYFRAAPEHIVESNPAFCIGDKLGIVVTVHMLGQGIPTRAYGKLFTAAAEAMGLNPTLEEETGVASICGFALEAPLSADGRAILKMVRDQVDAVHAEAQRLHSEQKKNPTTSGE